MGESPEQLHVRIAVLEEKIIGLESARELQAREYERRLAELNHSHRKSIEDREKFLDKALFYSKWEDVIKWHSEIDKWRSKIIGIGIGISLASGVAGGALASLMSRLTH